MILLLAQLGPPATMQPSAWAFMLSVWSVIIGFTVWCFYKLLNSERQLDGDEAEPPPSSPSAASSDPTDTAIQETP